MKKLLLALLAILSIVACSSPTYRYRVVVHHSGDGYTEHLCQEVHWTDGAVVLEQCSAGSVITVTTGISSTVEIVEQ